MSDFLSTPEGVVVCLYAAISFQPGQEPNYNLMNALFHPQARITPPATDSAIGVLRLRSCFAMRGSHFAQDDN